MPDRVLYPQFRDQFEPTSYPFARGATLKNDDGKFFLEGTFLDAHVYPIGGKERIYISKVVVSATKVAIWIGDAVNDSLASGTFLLSSIPDNVYLLDAYERPAGIFVSERRRLAIFQTWGVGTHTFDVTATELAVTCCLPAPEVGVRGILLEDGTLFTGRVWIVGDDGVVVSYAEMSLPGTCNVPVAKFVDAVRIDIVGDPLFRRRLCEPVGPAAFSTPKPIKKLRIRNGNNVFECPPDEYGNFTVQMNDNLASDTALRVRTTKDGIVIQAEGTQITGATNG